MVTGICFTKEKIIGADVKGGTYPDDIFRAKRFFAQFCRGNSLWSNTWFFCQFLLCHAKLFPAAQYAVADLP